MNIRLRSSCFPCYQLLRRCYSTIRKEAKTLSKEFNMTPEMAQLFIIKNKITANHDNLMDTINICKQLGFSKEDLLNHPKLLNRKYMVIDQHSLVAKEGGIQNVTASVLANFRRIFNATVETLKEDHKIPKEINVAESFISHLNPPPESISTHDLTDEKPFSHIHMQVMKRYLMWRLEASIDDIERLFRIHKMVKNKSLKYLCENIQLAEELGFAKDKILKYGYILHNYPPYTKTMLETMPIIAGIRLARAMRLYPKLIMISPRNYNLIYNYLKEANIPDIAIAQSMNVFKLSPKTVKRRLEEIAITPEYSVYLADKNVLKLVVHNKRARSRLELLKKNDMRCNSLQKLRADIDGTFDLYVKEGNDVYLPNETINFVKTLFGEPDASLVGKKLKMHPMYNRVPLFQMQCTFNYLLRMKYRKEDLLATLTLLLYPVSKIKEANKMLSQLDVGRPTKVQKLNLILYLLEKVHHFTGNGIWLDNKEKGDGDDK